MRQLSVYLCVMLMMLSLACGGSASRRAASSDGCECPDWFDNPPADSTLFVAMGFGRHSDRRKAERAALMEANKVMASLMPTAMADSMDFDVRIARQEVVAGHGEYCAFVMLQMPRLQR